MDTFDTLIKLYKRGLDESEIDEAQIDWEAIQSAAMDVLAYSRRRNMQGLTEAMDELTTQVLLYINMPV